MVKYDSKGSFLSLKSTLTDVESNGTNTSLTLTISTEGTGLGFLVNGVSMSDVTIDICGIFEVGELTKQLSPVLGLVEAILRAPHLSTSDPTFWGE